MRKAKSLFNRIKISIIQKINFYFLNLQKQNLVSHLGSIGDNVALQMPVHISGADNVEIGENVSIAAYVHIWGQGGIKIGDRVMIASNSSITSITHDYKKEYMYKTVIKSQVIIEDDVWIGTNSVILPGILVGKGAVIGAGSVVTKNVKPYSIVFGCPAQHHKFREIEN